MYSDLADLAKMCLVTNCNELDPFPVGVFAGDSKPSDANEFLTPFVDELLDIIQNGITINSFAYRIEIHNFACDAPARAFIMMTKSHSGFSSCPRCTAEGNYINFCLQWLLNQGHILLSEAKEMKITTMVCWLC